MVDTGEESEESITQLRESKREVDEIEVDVLCILFFVLLRSGCVRNSRLVYPEDGALEESICSCVDECRELKKECLIYIHSLTTK